MMLVGGGLALLVALLAWAAWGDVRRYIIPNRISLLILAAYFPFSVGAAFLPGLYPSVNWFSGLIVGGAVLLAGFVLFARGIMGGGDVKLLASTSVWAGPALVFPLLMVTALAGGLVALGVLMARGRRAPASGEAPLPLPYGVASAAGGLVVAERLAAAVWSAAI
jgi:prepilin peptidase CpaA